jgi:catechol 2,3-dioxygenase-like lactoylglutathione lyase family enzyme
MRFDGICLITGNVPALAQFYTRVLGVKAEGDENHVELQTAGAHISIFSIKGMEEMAPQSMEGAGYGSITLGLEVEDVDAEFERLKRLGVELVKLPASYPWGTRSAWFRDPDGNILDFFARLTK